MFPVKLIYLDYTTRQGSLPLINFPIPVNYLDCVLITFYIIAICHLDLKTYHVPRWDSPTQKQHSWEQEMGLEWGCLGGRILLWMYLHSEQEKNVQAISAIPSRVTPC